MRRPVGGVRIKYAHILTHTTWNAIDGTVLLAQSETQTTAHILSLTHSNSDFDTSHTTPRAAVRAGPVADGCAGRALRDQLIALKSSWCALVAMLSPPVDSAGPPSHLCPRASLASCAHSANMAA